MHFLMIFQNFFEGCAPRPRSSCSPLARRHTYRCAIARLSPHVTRTACGISLYQHHTSCQRKESFEGTVKCFHHTPSFIYHAGWFRTWSASAWQKITGQSHLPNMDGGYLSSTPCTNMKSLIRILEALNLSAEERNGSRVLWSGPWIAPEALPWVAGGHSASPPGSLRRQHAGIASSEPPAGSGLEEISQVFPDSTRRKSYGYFVGKSYGYFVGKYYGYFVGKYYGYFTENYYGKYYGYFAKITIDFLGRFTVHIRKV
jgi:hypothetical protein